MELPQRNQIIPKHNGLPPLIFHTFAIIVNIIIGKGDQCLPGILGIFTTVLFKLVAQQRAGVKSQADMQKHAVQRSPLVYAAFIAKYQGIENIDDQ